MIQRIRSPLMRVGYGFAEGTAVLLMLAAGRTSIRRGAGTLDQPAEGPRLLWLPEGAGGELLAEAGSRGTIVLIPVLALTRALSANALDEQIRRGLSQVISLPLSEPDALIALIDGLGNERQDPQPGADAAQSHYIALVLIHLWRLVRADLIAHGRAPQGLVERFVILAGQHARDHWPVSRYAATLAVSRDRLGTAVRRATGLSPQGYLHRQLIREAGELLANTGMPVAQVAFRLGFADAAYFNRFFARKSGTTPGRYRREARSHRARGDTSFAAWP